MFYWLSPTDAEYQAAWSEELDRLQAATEKDIGLPFTREQALRIAAANYAHYTQRVTLGPKIPSA